LALALPEHPAQVLALLAEQVLEAEACCMNFRMAWEVLATVRQTLSEKTACVAGRPVCY